MALTIVNFDDLTANAHHYSFMNDFDAFVEATAWEAIGSAITVIQTEFAEIDADKVPTLDRLYAVAIDRINATDQRDLNEAQQFVHRAVIDHLLKMEHADQLVLTYTATTDLDFDQLYSTLRITLYTQD